MRTVVVGAGPTGLFTAIALARRGREVIVVDRDPGPPPSGQMPSGSARASCSSITRTHSAVRSSKCCGKRCRTCSMTSSLPAQRSRPPPRTDRSRCCAGGRRSSACCGTARQHSRASRCCVVMSTGSSTTAAGPSVSRSTAAPLRAGLVIDASGRSSRFTDGIRPPAEGGDCGAVYVTRQYRLLDRARHRADELTDRLVAGILGLLGHRVPP